MNILNLTQHVATPAQVAAGVVDLSSDDRAALRDALTFDSLPSREEIENRAVYIATLAATEAETGGGLAVHAMIGGAPYLMAPLEDALRTQGIEPVYAFSVRESGEQTQTDGSIRKVNVFLHVGFVF